MPLFEYRCDAGHLTEELLPSALPGIACACGLDAVPVVSRPGRGVVRGGTNGGQDATLAPRADAVTTVRYIDETTRVVEVGKGGFRVQHYRCGTCKASGMEVHRRDEPVPPAPACCGAAMGIVDAVAADIDWFTRATQGSIHGLYDRAAGRWFSSKSERKAWMEEQGLADWNDIDDNAVNRRRSERERQMDDEAVRVLDAYDRDPVLRRMRDQGRVRDWSMFRPDGR